MQQPEVRYAQAGDGSVAYQVFGEGPIDLLIVPGAASHIELAWVGPGYAAFMGRLASFARVMTYDKRGTGLSDPAVGLPTLDDRITDVLAVLDTVGSRQAALFGYSEGGPVSAVFAATYPQRCTALILGESFVQGSEIDQDWVSRVMELWGTGSAVDLFVPETAAKTKPTAAARRMYGMFERAAASPSMFRACMESVRRIDVRPVLSSIGVPTLVLHRVDEPLPVAQARVAASAIPGARLIELPGGDHLPWLGDAERYLDEIEEFLTGTKHSPVPERVLSTVLFADVVQSTEKVAQIGDRSWHQLLDRYESDVRDVIARVEGREIFTKGDEFFIAFSGPARAVECGQRMHSVAAEAGLVIRVGVHIGECETRGEDLTGIAVHIAARVMSTAAPGELLVTSTVRDLMVGGGFRFVDRGRRKLKGIPDEWSLFAVPSETDEPITHESALTRRDKATIGVIRRAPRMARRFGEWQLMRSERRKSRDTAAAAN